MHIPEIRDDKVTALRRTLQWPGIEKLQVRATNRLQLADQAERSVAGLIAAVDKLNLLRLHELDTALGSRDYLHAVSQRVSPGVEDY